MLDGGAQFVLVVVLCVYLYHHHLAQIVKVGLAKQCSPQVILAEWVTLPFGH